MVPSEVNHFLPNLKNNVPGGGPLLWRICNRVVITAVGLASKGFLKLQRNVNVEGLDKFLNILEQNRDRGIITGISLLCTRLSNSIKSSFRVCTW